MRKHELLLLLTAFACSFSYCQSLGNLSEQALMNGCTDGTNARGGQTFGAIYYSIMENPSISAEYKDSYRQAYTQCFGGGKYYYKKDKLVYDGPKNPKDSTIKPGTYSFKTYLGGLKKL